MRFTSLKVQPCMPLAIHSGALGTPKNSKTLYRVKTQLPHAIVTGLFTLGGHTRYYFATMAA